MATKRLPIVPPQVPAAGVAELLKHLPAIVRSDPVNYNGDSAVNLFEVPGGILIMDLQINVITAFDGTGTSAAAISTITVPGDTGAITVFDSDSTKIQAVTTDQYLPSTNAGFIHVPSSGGMVQALLTPNTTTQGQYEVYMRYVPDVSKL